MTVKNQRRNLAKRLVGNIDDAEKIIVRRAIRIPEKKTVVVEKEVALFTDDGTPLLDEDGIQETEVREVEEEQTVIRQLKGGDDVTEEAKNWPNLRMLVKRGFVEVTPGVNYRTIPRKNLPEVRKEMARKSAMKRNRDAAIRCAGLDAANDFRKEHNDEYQADLRSVNDEEGLTDKEKKEKKRAMRAEFAAAVADYSSQAMKRAAAEMDDAIATAPDDDAPTGGSVGEIKVDIGDIMRRQVHADVEDMKAEIANSVEEGLLDEADQQELQEALSVFLILLDAEGTTKEALDEGFKKVRDVFKAKEEKVQEALHAQHQAEQEAKAKAEAEEAEKAAEAPAEDDAETIPEPAEVKPEPAATEPETAPEPEDKTTVEDSATLVALKALKPGTSRGKIAKALKDHGVEFDSGAKKADLLKLVAETVEAADS